MKNKLISVGLACFMMVSCICPTQAFATTNGFTSDTTKDFEINANINYTLKITPDNAKSNVNVTTGNSGVARIIVTIKKDNSYYVTISATGNKDDQTNLYVNLGNKPVKLCTVTVGYPVGITGKHLNKVLNENGQLQLVQVQDKGWQLQIEKKDIQFKINDRCKDIILVPYESSVNQNEKYFIIAVDGGFYKAEDLVGYGISLTNSLGKQLEIKSYNENQFKVSYDNIDDVKEMYFGTATEKAKLTMIEFK